MIAAYLGTLSAKSWKIKSVRHDNCDSGRVLLRRKAQDRKTFLMDIWKLAV